MGISDAMEFQTKIIEKKKNPRARVAFAGIVLLVMAMILAVIRGNEQAAMCAFGIGMVVLVGGAIYAKGDLSHTGISATDLVVNVAELRIGTVAYPIAQVDKLEFCRGKDRMPVLSARCATCAIIRWGIQGVLCATGPVYRARQRRMADVPF